MKPLVEFISRKFLLTVGIVLATIALLIIGKVDQTTFENVVQWVITVYIGGNVAEKKFTPHPDK